MFDPGDISELRARLTSHITILEGFIANITEQKTQKSLARLVKQIDEQEQKQILDWISKDCERQTDRLNWLISRHEPGTRKWLFDSTEWRAWTSDQGKGTTLFCPGIPGAGKTHASASKRIQSAMIPTSSQYAALIFLITLTSIITHPRSRAGGHCETRKHKLS